MTCVGDLVPGVEGPLGDAYKVAELGAKMQDLEMKE